MKRIAVACAVGCLIVPGLLEGQRPSPEEWRAQRMANAERVRANRVSGTVEGTGTVRYDPGSPSFNATAPSNADFLGNLFNSGNGQPLESGTVTRVSWYQGRGCGITVCGKEGLSTSFASVAVFPNEGSPSGHSGRFVTVSTFAFNSVSLTAVVDPTFFVGLYVPSTGPGEGGMWGSVGVASATTNGQGFHGHQRSFAGSDSTPLTNLNVVMRATGNIVIPVELLEFELE